MQISVTFRHLEPDEGVKAYVREKVKRLRKFLENPREAHVVLSVEKFRHSAELTILKDGLTVNSEGRDRDLYAAIDQMVDKMDRQIRERRQKGKRKRVNPPSLGVEPDEQTPSEKKSRRNGISSLIQKKRISVKPMSLEEAMAQLKLSEEPYLFFINSHSGEMNALHRTNGDYEWIEPYYE
jgi:putative sigma-54 modulation protein